MDIRNPGNGLAHSISNSLSISSSPEAQRQQSLDMSFQSQYSSMGKGVHRTSTSHAAKQLKPFATGDIKILLLENVNESGQKILRDQGYQVEATKTSMSEADLIDRIK